MTVYYMLRTMGHDELIDSLMTREILIVLSKSIFDIVRLTRGQQLFFSLAQTIPHGDFIFTTLQTPKLFYHIIFPFILYLPFAN